jgi:hypothetical protein
VREDHASAAVPLQAQLVKGLPTSLFDYVCVILPGVNSLSLEKVKVGVPLVADNLKINVRSQ